MSSNDGLTHARAERWRTEWKALDTNQVHQRLRKLYWLRDFVMASADAIPLSWQHFLVAEIEAGERRLLDFQEAEETCADESFVYAATDEDIPF